MPKDFLRICLNRPYFKHFPAQDMREPFIGRLAAASREKTGLIKSDEVVLDRYHARLGFEAMTVRQKEPFGRGGPIRAASKKGFRIPAFFQIFSLSCFPL